MKKYFAFDGESVEFFETKEEAIKFCNDALEFYRDDAFEYGWLDEATQVCWGKVKQFAQQCNILKLCEKKSDCQDPFCLDSHNTNFDFECDYELKDLE